MDTLRRTGVGVMVCAVAGLFFQCSCIAGAEQAQTVQKPAGQSEQLLREIMDLHVQLVTNDVFLSQAKMLGAYLESAQPMEEIKKVEIYKKVLDILGKIKESATQVPASPVQQKAKPEQKSFGEEQQDKSVYVPGAALLEVFKADSMETIPELPVIRTYWRRDLAYTGGFLLPDRYSEIGKNGAPYVARFSFYYEAKESGDYGFTLLNERELTRRSACKLTVGGVDVVKASQEPSTQGVCKLVKGFHRVEFWLLSRITTSYQPPGVDVLANRGTSFEVKILVPNALDSVRLTKETMLLKADQIKTPQGAQGEKAKGAPIPYVDY